MGDACWIQGFRLCDSVSSRVKCPFSPFRKPEWDPTEVVQPRIKHGDPDSIKDLPFELNSENSETRKEQGSKTQQQTRLLLFGVPQTRSMILSTCHPKGPQNPKQCVL